MQEILSLYLWIFVLVYINNIIVYSQSWDDHLKHLDAVLGSIARAGVMLAHQSVSLATHPYSCLAEGFAARALHTQGESSSDHGARSPNSVPELQCYLEMVIYFSAYISHYSHIAAPLFALLKKGARWAWQTEHDLAFQNMHNALAHAPVLGHPIQGSLYHLVQASAVGSTPSTEQGWSGWPFLPSQTVERFAKDLELVCANTCDALILAQEKQACAYNAKRRPMESIKPSDLDMLPAAEEWEVKAILGHKVSSRKSRHKRYYLVRWKGLDTTKDPWLLEYKLHNAPEIKREYLQCLEGNRR
ncbi:tick transposon [Salix suchowensis]|nr:tick transposon [Salix suchowensis]